MDDNLRKNLLEALTEEPAHVNFERAIKNIPPHMRAKRPAPAAHSIWDELNHIRITNEDILNYTFDPKWVSPPWPEEHWVKPVDKVSDSEWEKCINAINADLKKTIDLIQNKNIDLTSEIPHGEGRTYLREILLIIDHNGYHLGQVLLIRKLLNIWDG